MLRTGARYEKVVVEDKPPLPGEAECGQRSTGAKGHGVVAPIQGGESGRACASKALGSQTAL